MKQFLTLSYYFNTAPGANFRYWLVMFIFAGVLIVIASLIKTYSQKTEDKILKKMIKTYPAKFFWFGIVAILLTVARLENITFFSMRFFWIVYFGLLIYIIVTNIKTFYREYPRKVKQSLSHKGKNKYLPTQKKKKKRK